MKSRIDENPKSENEHHQSSPVIGHRLARIVRKKNTLSYNIYRKYWQIAEIRNQYRNYFLTLTIIWLNNGALCIVQRHNLHQKNCSSVLPHCRSGPGLPITLFLTKWINCLWHGRGGQLLHVNKNRSNYSIRWFLHAHTMRMHIHICACVTQSFDTKRCVCVEGVEARVSRTRFIAIKCKEFGIYKTQYAQDIHWSPWNVKYPIVEICAAQIHDAWCKNVPAICVDTIDQRHRDRALAKHFLMAWSLLIAWSHAECAQHAIAIYVLMMVKAILKGQSMQNNVELATVSVRSADRSARDWSHAHLPRDAQTAVARHVISNNLISGREATCLTIAAQ